MLSLIRFLGNMRWLIAVFFIVSVSYAQELSGSQDEDGSSADLDDQLNTALNITDRQNFVFNSSFVLSSSSCITPDREQGSCKAVSRCPKHLERASHLETEENIEFFRERICRLLHRTVHVCCPNELEETESTQSQPLPDTQPGTRQRPQSQPQPPTTQTQPEQPFRTRPDSRLQPGDQPEGKEQPKPESDRKQGTQPSSTDQIQQAQRPQTDRPSATQPPTESVTQTQNTSWIPSEDECGLPIGASRLPEEELKPGNWPWLAIIGRRNRRNDFVPTCTGTLITRRHVLTAAHCVEETTVDAVMLGEHHLVNNNAGENPEDYSIVNRSIHDFNKTTFENDIALLTLDRDVVFNDFIQPACLPFNFTSNQLLQESLTLVAWQTTDLDNPKTSKMPLETNAPVVEMNQCIEEYQNVTQNMPIDDRQLCASTEGLDTCLGESGGPLHYLNPENGKFYLVGVASFEPQCPASDLPTIFTKVSSFLDWIQNSLQETPRSLS